MAGTDDACVACLSSDGDLLQMPCSCRGSVGWAHIGCLERIRASREDGACPTCHAPLGDVEATDDEAYVMARAREARKTLYVSLFMFLVLLASLAFIIASTV